MVLGYEHDSFEDFPEFRSLNKPLMKNGLVVISHNVKRWYEGHKHIGKLADGTKVTLPSGWLILEPRFLLDDSFPFGCYAFYCDGILSYIGSSANLFRRIESHLPRGFSQINITEWGTFSSVVIKYRYARKPFDWLTLEAKFIRRLQPRFNLAGVITRNLRYVGGNRY